MAFRGSVWDWNAPTEAVAQHATAAPALTLYPNPTSSHLLINWNADAPGPYHVRVRNVAGADIYEQSGELMGGHNSVAMAVSQLPAGVYELEWIESGTILRAKFVVR
jgi:hypothetical protein